MNDTDIEQIIPILERESKKWEVPIVTHLAVMRHDPFVILISTLLSLRTKDEVTAEATRRLLRLADTPAEMLKLSPAAIEEAIYPVGFYRNKAKNILAICEELLHRYDSRVPDNLEQLLTMPGVGRKTANLVLTLGFNKDGICVDTHVHRISNRWGYVKTKTPEQTEFALREKLPRRYWIDYNTFLVAFGQQICRPVSPLCSICPVSDCCSRIGVEKSR